MRGFTLCHKRGVLVVEVACRVRTAISAVGVAKPLIRRFAPPSPRLRGEKERIAAKE
jgi:hypothetical protein